MIYTHMEREVEVVMEVTEGMGFAHMHFEVARGLEAIVSSLLYFPPPNALSSSFVVRRALS